MTHPRSGHGLDDWTARVASGAGTARLVPVDTGIALRRVGGNVDPHYWLAAPNAKRIAARKGRALVFAAFDAEGAHAAGLPVGRLLTLHHVLLALVVIAGVSVVGVVLASALLVIPAATAKLFAPSLGTMFRLAPLFGVGSVLAGLAISYRCDVPSGPAIVVVAGMLFLCAWGRVAMRSWGRPR